MGAPIRWASGLLLLILLLCCAHAAPSVDEQVAQMDALVASKLQETRRAYAVVAQQLSAAGQVAELFVLEDAQLELLALETRARLAQVQEEVRDKMQAALNEVDALRRATVDDATAWRETVEGLKAATRAKRQALQRKKMQREIEEDEERKMQALQQLERQREEEKELERLQQEEKQKQQETEKTRLLDEKKRFLDEKQELEEQRELEEQQQKQKLEEQQRLKMEKQRQEKTDQLRQLKEMQEMERQQELKRQQKERHQIVEEASRSQSPNTNEELPPEGREERHGRLLDTYVSLERVVVDAAATIYRQLVLPVVAVLGFFFVLTVVIARYNSVKQARRNRRVLYSGYPKTYRRKTDQEQKAVPNESGDQRPRYRHSAPHPDPNDFIGN
ncbi:uncharacterized protein IUM83_11782 [Phytophthora cinnamomi]|uniref:uncharacterized protein n=1 Tax=Phytophthora cinnamomi TaxID=4785 RepID=UPI00355ABA5E|nr:hypothetical protein IUM83_11782 [Phytophthora cinnamomi]